jgi:GT2 family glycosyltransferase
LVLGPRWGIGVVPARARPADWLAARTVVGVAPEGFVVRRLSRVDRVVKLVATTAKGAWLATRLAWSGVPEAGVEREAWTGMPRRADRPTVAVAVLSYNRYEALEKTLRHLEAEPALAGTTIIIADNGSTDGSAERVRAEFPRVQVLALNGNRGVAAFNQAVAQTDADAVLILDDDARPEPGVLGRALDLLAERPDLGAVTLHPRHPESKASEWPFAAGPADDWPVMGCANLVRRHAWDRVGGYEESFFLYRNDTDLAMKLLEAGFGVHFNPEWVVWHDSPAAARKSPRWFDLATRNWVWLCRRHGRGVTRVGAALAGWVWAHRLAGWSIPCHARAVWGFLRGCAVRPPPLPDGLLVDGRPLRRLMRLRFGRE